jgi:hypothetical protein
VVINLKAGGIRESLQNAFKVCNLEGTSFHDYKSIISILNNGEVRRSTSWDGEFKKTIVFGIIDYILQEISCKDKEKWGERISLSYSSFAVESFSRYAI